VSSELSQTGQLKSNSEFNKKPMQPMS